jgi:hypothetical protein
LAQKRAEIPEDAIYTKKLQAPVVLETPASFAISAMVICFMQKKYNKNFGGYANPHRVISEFFLP